MQHVSEVNFWLAPRAVLAGACVAIFFSAFELIEPVIETGPVAFTTSEMAAAFFLVTAAYWSANTYPLFLSRRALDIPVLLFLAGNFISSGFAADRTSAIKFSLRMTYAVLIYFGISRLPGRKYLSHVFVSGAITTTVLVVALLGIAETFIFSRYNINPLDAFQQGITTFGSLYNMRTMSTLPYPTVLSFYLELTLPIIFAFSLWLASSVKSSFQMRCIFSMTIIVTAAVFLVQIYTYTRSGLVAMLLALFFGVLFARHYLVDRAVWKIYAAAIMLLLLLICMLALVSNPVAARLGLADQEEDYMAEYSLLQFPEDLSLGGDYTATLRVTNTSQFDWTRDGRRGVFISYRWIKYPEMLRSEAWNQATWLPEDLAVGESSDFEVTFSTPAEYGRYLLLFDLFKTRASWFSDAGVYPLLVPVEIDASASRLFELEEKPPLEDITFREPLRESVQESVPRTRLWEGAIHMFRDHPVLGVGSDQFRLRYGEYLTDMRQDERLRTHNILLESLVNNGVVGLLVMVYLLGSAAWTQYNLVRRSSGDGVGSYGLALLVGTVIYVLHGMLDAFLWQTGVAFMFFTLLGLTSWLAYDMGREQDYPGV